MGCYRFILGSLCIFIIIAVCSISRDMAHACSFTVSKAINFGAFVVRRPLNLQSNLSSKFPLRSIRMEHGDNCTPLGANKESSGALVVFEGLDRSGKTSQCGRLLSYLEGLGHSVELWRFPDRTTSVGQMISSYLANKSQLDDHTIHLLFSANRWEKRNDLSNQLPKDVAASMDKDDIIRRIISKCKG